VLDYHRRPEAPPPADDAPDPASGSAAGRPFGVLLLLFAASGCSALIYEVLWFHMLELVVGSSALSLGILLATYMGGLGLGSLLFARYVPRARDPVRPSRRRLAGTSSMARFGRRISP